MKHLYSVSVGIIPAVADLTQVSDCVWELNRINVPQQSRGLGHGKKLLRKVTDGADQEGVQLVLWINPYGPLDHEALACWYGRNRFTALPEGSAWEMIRHPNPNV